MRDKNKRFGYHAVITIKDRLDGDTCVINTSIDKNTKKEIYDEIAEDLEQYYQKIMLRFKDELSKEEIQKKIYNLKHEKKWGNRRIENWFAKFGIEIDLPKQGKIKKGQTVLN